MTPTQPNAEEIHPQHPPVVPIPQDPFLPRGPVQRLVNLFPGGQFFRYLMVGVFNTLFGYTSLLVVLKLLENVIPLRYLSLTAVAASIISTPLNITVAYFGYKFFVFRTEGNYLLEWLKCFAVYGTGMIPGLIALGGLTRLLQGLIHRHAATLHANLAAVEAHLGGAPLTLVQHLAHSKSMAADIAAAVVIAVSTIYSFIGHKKVTFKASTQTAS